jgi:hypothetical protein
MPTTAATSSVVRGSSSKGVAPVQRPRHSVSFGRQGDQGRSSSRPGHGGLQA